MERVPWVDSPFRLVGHPSATDVEDGAGGEGAARRCGPGHHLGDLRCRTAATHGDLGGEGGEVVRGRLGEQVGLDDRRGDRVDEYPRSGELLRERLRETDDSGLRCGVCALLRVALL